MGRSTVHYADNKTNNALKQLHNKLRPAGTPVQRVEYIIELLLLRIFETKLKQDEEFKPLRKLFSSDYSWKNPKTGKEESNENRLFSYLPTVSNEQILSELNDNFFPFYSSILHSARDVFQGNLPQKVKDQLVLIEEVFSNSNFTNNVNSGNLGEVISIVANDIEEARLLKTDLLGDAIESALSETGGTKDVGLFRTPDHIRQFMTAMIEPTFDDVIFDPACGTGGFLFDAFEFVMRRVDAEREWPGEKANTELRKWFDNYFKENQLEFPNFEQTTQFYRNGVTGIEYLGMIRKMAAINFYIRGLNPENIEQGDSLAKYRPVTDHESKSIILANPPFGAQRDQEAYPDVWQEYSKESETTILFVKLMFEQLKQGGKCAVVVSEGFNTWDQFSAKALRKMLLDEANLRAVISLPQGLFVSKSGVGPKTSILIFEKGGRTDWTWFYKITNDGYTMGTNRKEQKGNQLIECLKLYHKYVKHGQKPPESKNQFCIPVEWIKTLDPRIKQKIRKEAREELTQKAEIEKFKIIGKWNNKTVGKGALVHGTPQSLWNDYKKANPVEAKQFEDITENKIQNEIAKRIDKAHNYSFNLANYKSAISDSQIKEWNNALQHIQPNGVTNLDDIFKKLETNKPENVLPYLVKLNPTNTLEADIAREYVSNIEENIVTDHKEIYTIKKILKNGAKYPMVKLHEFLKDISDERKIIIDDELIYKDPTISTKTNTISTRNEEKGKFLKVKKRISIQNGDFVIGLLHTQNGAFAFANDEYASTGTFIPLEIDINQISKKYLFHLMKRALKQLIKDDTTGRENYKIEEILDIEIPLPSIEVQNLIADQIERQKEIFKGVEKIINNWAIDDYIDFSVSEEAFSNIAIVDGQIIKDEKLRVKFSQLYVGGEYIQSGTGVLKKLKTVKDAGIVGPSYIFKSGQVVYSKVRPNLQKCFYATFDGICSSDIYPLTIINKNVAPEYLAVVMQSKYFANKTLVFQDRAGMPKINRDQLATINIVLPSIDMQQTIVETVGKQIKILKDLEKMKAKSEDKINSILDEIWGVEYSEPIKEEVLNEQEN
jgi:restriction endonuclease S subunit